MRLTPLRLPAALLVVTTRHVVSLAHGGRAQSAKGHDEREALTEVKTHKVSLRERSCRDFLSKWASSGVVDLSLVCREAYTDAACAAAEASFGGSWPEFGTMMADEVADKGCAALEDRLRHAQSLVFTQLEASTSRLTSSRTDKKEETAQASAEHPPWVRNAFVLNEDDLWSEIPYPHSVGSSTHDGPRLYPSSRATQIEQERDEFNYHWFGIWPHEVNSTNSSSGVSSV